MKKFSDIEFSFTRELGVERGRASSSKTLIDFPNYIKLRQFIWLRKLSDDVLNEILKMLGKESTVREAF